MAAHDPVTRKMVAQLAALSRWSKTSDRAAATAPARRALIERYEHDVDPQGRLDPRERRRRAIQARDADLLRHRLQARRAARLVDQAAAAVQQVRDELDAERPA